MPKFRVGTRESKLALLQTDMVLARCAERFPDAEFEIVGISTSGDKILNKPIAALGGTGVFVKELEDALLENRVDFVVHSLKDMPTQMPEGLQLGATLIRHDPRDCFVGRNNIALKDLPRGAKIATSSRRRAAQLAAMRNDLEFVDVRGNVPTRLRKLDEGHAEGMVLASAGLTRLGLADRITHYFELDQMVPAAGQGAIALQYRTHDESTAALMVKLRDQNTWLESHAERGFLAKLGGGCSVPIGVIAMSQPNNTLALIACVADGTNIVRTSLSAAVNSAEEASALGIEFAELTLRQGADVILESIMQRPQQPISPP